MSRILKEDFASKNLAGTVFWTHNLSTHAALDSVIQWLMCEFDLLLCQPTFGPFRVASTLGDLAVAAKAAVSVASKQTQSQFILKE